MAPPPLVPHLVPLLLDILLSHESRRQVEAALAFCERELAPGDQESDPSPAPAATDSGGEKRAGGKRALIELALNAKLQLSDDLDQVAGLLQLHQQYLSATLEAAEEEGSDGAGHGGAGAGVLTEVAAPGCYLRLGTLLACARALGEGGGGEKQHVFSMLLIKVRALFDWFEEEAGALPSLQLRGLRANMRELLKQAADECFCYWSVSSYGCIR